MESPHKRQRISPPTNSIAGQDFVPLGSDESNASGNEEDGRYGYGNEDPSAPISPTPRGSRARYKDYRGQPWYDRKHAQDRPKSKHVLPGHEPWILVKTKLGRRFVHNTVTRESFWRIPDTVFVAVKELEQYERSQTEKKENAAWAEEELNKMREKSRAEEVNSKADVEEKRARRRRSESLQREDEEAMMAELAAEAEHAEEQDVKNVVKSLEPVVGDVGYDSEGSYEYVEVTDSEGEGGEEDVQPASTDDEIQIEEQQAEDGPVEFGEDDIAYQLAAMGQEYGLDPGEYGEMDLSYEDGEKEDGWDEEVHGLRISDEDATHLFRDMLDDHHVSPFTPWDKLIADESELSILNDDRYTILPNMKARKDAWDTWTRDRAAQIHAERAKMEKKDPRIPYLAFLAEKATPKLYWPEFKRKFKREPEMNERKLSEKDKEKLYRDHVNRLKLPESARKADLITLLKGIPLRHLNRDTSLDALPQQMLSHLHFISLPATTRDKIVKQHIAALPPAPEAGEEVSDEQRAEEDRKRADRRKREEALVERQRVVDEERRQAEKEERFARRGLREEEMELRRAMDVGGRQGLRAQLEENVGG